MPFIDKNDLIGLCTTLYGSRSAPVDNSAVSSMSFRDDTPKQADIPNVGDIMGDITKRGKIPNPFDISKLGDISKPINETPVDSSGYDPYTTCTEIVNKISENEDLYAQINENAQLKDLYSQLVGNKQEDIQKDVQQTKFKQVKTYTLSTVNYWLYILFYLSCLLLTAMLFFFSKSPTILAMSKYIKIAIILVAITYPVWISLIDQIVVFVFRYLYALAMGVPYTRKVRQ